MSLDYGYVAVAADFAGVVALPWAKIGQQRGAQEMVTIDDTLVGRVLLKAFRESPMAFALSGSWRWKLWS